MSQLIFDIETIGEDFDSLDALTQDSLTYWIKRDTANETETDHILEDVKNGLGFSPLTGQIIAIAMLDYQKNKGAVYFQAPEQKIGEFQEGDFICKQMTESEMLKKFWQVALNYQQFVTFNGRAFDAPFLIIRSAVSKIKPSVNLMPYRYGDNLHIDLLDQLTFYGAVRRRGNLHLWTRAFGIKSPKAQGVSGHDVAPLFKAGKFADIARYSAGDVLATKELYEYWRDYVKK